MNKMKPTNMFFGFCSLLDKNQSVKQKTCSHYFVSESGWLSRMSSCILIFVLGILLVFLSSCSTSTQNPSGMPSLITDESNTTSLSQSQLTYILSVKPTQAVPHIRPARPFPDFPPNYLQFPPQWLLNDFSEGTFVVGGDSIAANYQVWYEFIGKVNKNKEAVLTIQAFDIDSSKEVNDSTRYQKAERYRLSVAGKQAVWKCLSDDKNDITGKLSVMYDAETGLHELFIEGKKVFEFIYFPYDPVQSALYFGYTPLEELPSAYSKEDAIKDGCLVIEQEIIQNPDVLTNYSSYDDSNYAGKFIRIYLKDDEGIKIMDIGSYNERVCVTADYSRHSSRDNMEDIYVTTYYDNCVIGVEFDHDVYSLDLGGDYIRETIFIFKDMPFKKN